MLQCLHAKRHALESWRQLVEIILTACPQDLIQAEDRQLIIRDLLQDVHDKVTFPKLLYAAEQILIPFKYIVYPIFFSILDLESIELCNASVKTFLKESFIVTVQ